MAGPLITAVELTDIINTDDVVVVDCRWYLGEPDAGRSAYDDGHLPGAVYASLDSDLSGSEGEGRHPLPSPEAFAATMTRMGVTPSTTVVAYDDRGGAVASRLWWMLTDQGHASAAVLDGGLQAWTEEGMSVTTDVPQPKAGAFTTGAWSGVVDRDAVALRASGTALLDARSVERYIGTDEPVDPKAGHIPRALSMPLTENLNEDLIFLPATDLEARFAEVGITSETNVISQCGSGVTACHNILAMEIAGIGRPMLYVGSWSDWSNSDLPVATGPTP
jgi:thiosulfate/3-mercaptopyruvate sulfurtransferase